MANAPCLAGVNSIYAPQSSSNHRSATFVFSASRNLQPLRAQSSKNGRTTKTSGILRLNCEGNGREGIPWSEGTGNSLGRTAFDSNVSTTRGTACTKRSFVTMASMLGRKAKKREVVIPDPDYRIPVVLLGVAGVLAYQDNLLPAATVGLLGLLLLFQTTRVRFVFDDEALEVRVGDSLQESGENIFVGGQNRWKYSTFVNWELWWPNFPILVYFKERQTKPDGQVHFFPVIFNGKQLYDVLVERAGPSKTSGPK